MRVLYFTLCLIAVTASPTRTFKRNHPRKIEEKTVQSENEELPKTTENQEPRAIFEQLNVVSSTMSSVDGPQEFTPHVISLPQINIGWPQGSSTIAPKIIQPINEQKASLKSNDDPENVYTVNIYINFNEDGLVFQEEGKMDQRKKKPRPKPKPTTTTTTTEDYDYWYIDYVSLKDKPDVAECPDGFKKLNGKCAQRRCQKGEALVGGICVPVA